MTFNKKILIIAAIVLLLTLKPLRLKAFELISKFEGLKLKSYQDLGGIWTIGYGSTKNPFTGVSVKEGDQITKETAIQWLEKEIESRTDAIKKLIKVPVTSNQLAALTSLAYNIGLGAFYTSTLLRMLNAKAPAEDVANHFLKWNKVKGVVSKGLSNRRELERQLFLS